MMVFFLYPWTGHFQNSSESTGISFEKDFFLWPTNNFHIRIAWVKTEAAFRIKNFKTSKMVLYVKGKFLTEKNTNLKKDNI